MPIRLLDNYGRAALLRRRGTWTAQQRGPTRIEPRCFWPSVASLVNELDRRSSFNAKKGENPIDKDPSVINLVT